jgi:hypothetical protein
MRLTWLERPVERPVERRVDPAAAAGVPAGHLPSRPFRALALAVVAASVVIRGVLGGRQSYWIDELFSVSASGGGFATMLHRSATEVHTPLYATLLWAWIRIGGTGEAWTRTLSTACAVAAIVVAHRGLRGTGLPDHLRWALTAACAAGGTSLVYSLETRNYALLALGATGLTATTLRVALTTRAGSAGPAASAGRAASAGWAGSRRDRLAWVAWSALAATAHLLGAVLVLACAAVLVAVTIGPGGPDGRGRPTRRARVRQALGWVLLAAAGCAGQVAWLIAGLGRPGFASGTAWIGTPGLGSVRDLVTTTFASGGLSAHRDGFAWTSPAGVFLVLTGCAAAAVSGWVARRANTADPADPADPAGPASAGDGPGDVEAVAAVLLLGITALVGVGVFVIARWQHVWTLRNLSVVAPALMWGAICLAAALAGTGRARRVVAGTALVLLAAGLVPIGVGLARPYKTDFRGLFAYLSTVRAEHPDAALVFVGNGPPLGWGPVDAPLRAAPRAAGTDVDPVAVRSAAAVHRTAGTEVVVIYRGVADPDPGVAARRLAARLDPVACRPVDLPGLGLVRCG